MRRRDFLKIVGATGAAATALPGCSSRKPQSLIPYVIPHEEIIPGRSVWYSSVCRECPAGCGIRARVREGRVTKVEGNPEHPINMGGLCARGQASVQGLYSPDRLQTPLRKNSSGQWIATSWDEALGIMVAGLSGVRDAGAAPHITWLSNGGSGSLNVLIDEWLSGLGSNRRFRYEPFDNASLRMASMLAFGRDEIPSFILGSATVVVSFGADFLETWLSPVHQAVEWSTHRGTGDRRSITIVAGPRLSATAASADRFFVAKPEDLPCLALTVLEMLLQSKKSSGLATAERARVESIARKCRSQVPAREGTALADSAREICIALAGATHSIVMPGDSTCDGAGGTMTAFLSLLINYVCGNVGSTLLYQSARRSSRYDEMLDLQQRMNAGEVPALLINDANPVYAMPDGIAFAKAMRHVPIVIGFGTCTDETLEEASLVFPTHSPLEAWGDVEPFDGVHGLQQPAIMPLYGTRHLGDILLETGRRMNLGFGSPQDTYHEYLKDRWTEIHAKSQAGMPFDQFWSQALWKGGSWERLTAAHVSLKEGLELPAVPAEAEKGSSALSLMVYPHVGMYDGRGANKPWLHELPDPITRLVWGTVAEISTEDAVRLGIANGDILKVSSQFGSVEVPAQVTRGIHAGIIALPLGGGHTNYGRTATGVGVNVSRLLNSTPSSEMSGGVSWSGTQVDVSVTGRKTQLASLQGSVLQYGREIFQTKGQPDPARLPEVERETAPLYAGQEYKGHRWGMVIDLDRCTGCGACVTACYAENNIPVVGRDEVRRGRSMTWIRIDRYEGDGDGPASGFLPMLCQQCGNAPCETVCPVYAAYHTEEGLNGQVYNRCIGTRYCANNCPYKVRRFNWFDHTVEEPLNWQLNPDVTVRTKGVMEKCTFCVQRIVEARHRAKAAQQPVSDGDVLTACQQTCPSKAIVFGDLNDPKSEVVRLRRTEGSRAYRVLEEVNTDPAIVYMKRKWNGKNRKT